LGRGTAGPAPSACIQEKNREKKKRYNKNSLQNYGGVIEIKRRHMISTSKLPQNIPSKIRLFILLF
jgi:hypothetical protein